MHLSFVPVICALAALVGPVIADTSATGGDCSVTLNGKLYNPDSGKSANWDKKTDSSCKGYINVRGKHVGYDIDCRTLGVYNYTLTGFNDTQRMVTRPTVVFSAKLPTLTTAQLSGASIKDFDLRDDNFVVLFSTGAGKLKIQSKDGAQGGIFQMETEFSAAVEFTHTLGPSVFYFNNSVTNKINFGDGIDAVKAGPGAHNMLLGKDSPQVAKKTYQDGKTTKWVVQPGGRLGGVLGEDSTEMGASASNCTSDCQAQNQIKGSIPPTQDPVDPQPL